MNSDRRILSWLAVGLGSFVCAPCACVLLFLSLAGGTSALNPGYHWEVSDSFLLGGITVFGLLGGAAALALIIAGVLGLLHKKPHALTSEIDDEPK